MKQVTIHKQIAITLDLKEMAECFCEMNDDDQAQFFVEVAKIMETWPTMAKDNQPYYIGKHLAECDCSTPESREFITNIYNSMMDKCDV